jgi:hypothetical protein
MKQDPPMNEGAPTSDADPLRRALLAVLPVLALASEESAAVDAVQAQPFNFRIVLENEHVRVLEYNSRPGMAVCGVGMHSHPPHLTVALSEGAARVRLPDGKVMLTPPQPPGFVFWSEAETHEVENVSGRNMRSLIVELKSLKS